MFVYWLVRGSTSDSPLEVVRCSPNRNVVVAGESAGSRAQASSQFFTGAGVPDLSKEVTFEMIHAGVDGAPCIGEAIDAVNERLRKKETEIKPRKNYKVKGAKQQALQLLSQGCSVRESARLCGVPRSTVSDWKREIESN